ncbi:hypothetical protein LZ30DRAFT_810161, partial [Colletotrichum cereale]
RIEPGKVLKGPKEVPFTHDGHDALNRDRANGSEVEREIYEALGEKKLMLPFEGCREFEDRQGLLLAEADSHLLEYLEEGLATASMAERKRWCCQAADVVAYIHNHGGVHSDLRPERFGSANSTVRCANSEAWMAGNSPTPASGIWSSRRRQLRTYLPLALYSTP